MKENIFTIIGMVGEFFAALLGGRDSTLTTLVIFMTIDFATGLIVAAMGKSKHSKTSGLSSRAVGRSCKKGLHSADDYCGSAN